MTQLKCDVIHCMSNRDNCCCRPDIQIGGSDATQQQQTCCESFQCTHGSASNMSDAQDYSHVNASMPVHCEATNCVYNSHCECDAKAIQVSGQAAEQMDQTLCATFECGCGHAK